MLSKACPSQVVVKKIIEGKCGQKGGKLNLKPIFSTDLNYFLTVHQVAYPS